MIYAEEEVPWGLVTLLMGTQLDLQEEVTNTQLVLTVLYERCDYGSDLCYTDYQEEKEVYVSYIKDPGPGGTGSCGPGLSEEKE